jgi:hypothetical protein
VGGVAPVVQHLPSKCKALSSNPSTTKKKKNHTFNLLAGSEQKRDYIYEQTNKRAVVKTIKNRVSPLQKNMVGNRNAVTEESRGLSRLKRTGGITHRSTK